MGTDAPTHELQSSSSSNVPKFDDGDEDEDEDEHDTPRAKNADKNATFFPGIAWRWLFQCFQRFAGWKPALHRSACVPPKTTAKLSRFREAVA